MVLDYSKFDKIVDSDDEDAAPPAAAAPRTAAAPEIYTPEERARLLAEAQAAAARASADPDDSRSEIEKLKAERRAKRAAAGPQTSAPASSAPEPEVKPETEPEDDSPLAALDRAEKEAEAVSTEAASVLAAFKDGDKDAACKRATGLGGKLGKLQNAMEEISLGSLDDKEREAAKSRRKALNKRIEEELMPACVACRKAAAAAKSSA